MKTAVDGSVEPVAAQGVAHLLSFLPGLTGPA